MLLVQVVVVAAGFVMLRLSFWRRDRLRPPVRQAPTSDAHLPDATDGESPLLAVKCRAGPHVSNRAEMLGLRFPSEIAPRDFQPASENDEAILYRPENL